MKLLLPKFKMEYQISLNSTLHNLGNLSHHRRVLIVFLGLSDAFNAVKADFSSLAKSSTPLYISEVIHKTFIEVDEEGATGIAILPSNI